MEEVSPGHGAVGRLLPRAGTGQAVEESVFWGPVTNHSSPTSREVFCLVRGGGSVMKTLKKAIENLSLEK